jgi:DNA-binding NarL/FixJ family response regulator
LVKSLLINKQDVSPTVLIVEDHEALRYSLQKWLKVFFRDCTFLEVRSAEEALELSSEQKLDIILMDIKLPVMNGIEATRLLKEKNPDTKIVILSMYDAPDYQKSAASAGASAYVPKHKMYTEVIPIITNLLNDKENLLSDPTQV